MPGPAAGQERDPKTVVDVIEAQEVAVRLGSPVVPVLGSRFA